MARFVNDEGHNHANLSFVSQHILLHILTSHSVQSIVCNFCAKSKSKYFPVHTDKSYIENIGNIPLVTEM